MTHPLTDETIIELIGDRNLFHCLTEDDMRAAADWQLVQVIHWLRENLNWTEEDGINRYTQSFNFLIDKEKLIADLNQAMRPQQQEDNQ